MKRNPHFILGAALLIVDILAIIVSFGFAYYYRINFDSRPYLLGSDTIGFMVIIASLIPLWIALLFVSGVYERSIYMYRPKLYPRLFVVSAAGTMGIITFSYFLESPIFPARLIAVYSFILCFILLILGREIMLFIYRVTLRKGIGVLDVAIVGNNPNTRTLVEHLRHNLESGYRVRAIISATEYVPAFAKQLRYHSLSEAIEDTHLDVVIQTDEVRTEKVYFDSVDHHLSYMFVPSHKSLLSHNGEMSIMGTQPVVAVRTTPLTGWSHVVKRIFDLFFGTIIFVLALPVMIIVAIVIKLSEPRAKVLYRTRRLSRFGREVNIFKFRTMKSAYNDMSPEEAFEKMGRPELSKVYRENGDQLENDPRVGKVGRVLRRTSLDELPQLLNVLKGDISLVGPRALVPEELDKFYNKNLILSVKSGLTGLAQVSGRRNISFEERRSLDIYYIQNWSLGLDFQILLRTITSVLLARGAR